MRARDFFGPDAARTGAESFYDDRSATCLSPVAEGFALAVALLLLLPAAPSLGAGHDATTTRASLSAKGKQAKSGSIYPSISADGRYVAFESSARLAGNDKNHESDVFVRDRIKGETKRVSRAPGGAPANDWSGYAAISGDGRFVAFTSAASNLVANDRNGKEDVFIHDPATRTTERISVGVGGAEGNEDSAYPSISADGRFVAFVSAASNLVPGDTNGRIDLFVRDRALERTTRISLSSEGEQANADVEYLPPNAMSADGRYVAFNSTATNLVENDGNGKRDVFVHDRATKSTTRVSIASGGGEGDGSADFGSMSADGRFVVFESLATNLVPGDGNGWRDVFLHHLQTKTTVRVSVGSAGEEGDGDSGNATVSANGRFVAFDSWAPDLVAGDENDASDVFVHDRKKGKTKRVSLSVAAIPGNGDSDIPFLSADGRYVAFQSTATNLIDDDTNGVTDVYVRGPLR
jgi:Tol biopolymer transport system component